MQYVDAYQWAGRDSAYVTEEILADAYAGIDVYAGRSDVYEGATRFTEDVRGAVAQNAAETEQTRGPPAETKHSEVFPWKGWESYELTDEFREAVPYGIRHEFLRALANKTSTVKQGEERHMLIHVGGHAFHFIADGYMHGHMDGNYVVNSSSKQNLRQDRKEFLHGTDENTEGAGIWADEVSAIGGRSGGDISDSGRGRSENKGNDKVSGAERESNRAGYSEGDVENNEEVSEYGPGTMYYDGENG